MQGQYTASHYILLNTIFHFISEWNEKLFQPQRLSWLMKDSQKVNF